MSIHVCKCVHNGREEWHLRYPGMSESAAMELASSINRGAFAAPSPAPVDEPAVPCTWKKPGESDDAWIDRITGATHAPAPAPQAGWTINLTDSRDFCRVASVLIGATYTDADEALQRFERGSLWSHQRTYGAITATRGAPNSSPAVRAVTDEQIDCIALEWESDRFDRQMADGTKTTFHEFKSARLRHFARAIAGQAPAVQDGERIEKALAWLEGFVEMMGCKVEPAVSHIAALRAALGKSQPPVQGSEQ